MGEFIVIIRAANERTETLCKKLITQQGVSDKNIWLIHESPFTAALKKSFEIGIEKGKKWTFCVDADVLLRPNAIEKIIELAEKQPRKVCQVQGYMMDKFFGGVRRGGVHLYRTEHLPKILEIISSEEQDIRPESHALRQMKKKGYPFKVVPYIVGTHDDEQYNFDIYRKAFVQAEKHLSRAELLIIHWKEMAQKDHDFKVALKGFSDSITNSEPVSINNKLPLFKKMFEATGIPEKGQLNPEDYSLQMIEEKIIDWEYPQIYRLYFPYRDGLDLEMKGNWQKLKRNVNQKGFLKTSILSVSELLIIMGKRLRKDL